MNRRKPPRIGGMCFTTTCRTTSDDDDRGGGRASSRRRRLAVHGDRLERAAGDADGMRGAELIQTLRQAPAQRAGRLPHDERGGRRALCRQGAQPEEARHQLRAGPRPHQPHRPDGARDGEDGVRRHPHGDRSAAARSEPDQALAAALQCAAARRQVVSLYPAHRRPSARRRSSSIAARARARAIISAPSPRRGAVGRTINSLQRAFLLRTCTDSVFETRTRPCLLYQIKRCSAPCTGEISDDGLCRAGQRGEGLPFRQEPEGEGDIAERDAARPRKTSISSAPPSIATAWRRCRMSRAIRASIPQASRKPTSSPSITRAAVLHPGVLLPHRPELGQPRLFPEGRSGAARRPRCSSAFLAQFYDDKPCRGRSCSRETVEEQELLGEALSRKGRPQGRRSSCRSAARRRIWSTTPSPMPARRMAASLPKPSRSHACSKASRRPSGWPKRRGASRSTTTPTSWAPMPSAAWWSRGRKAS